MFTFLSKKRSLAVLFKSGNCLSFVHASAVYVKKKETKSFFYRPVNLKIIKPGLTLEKQDFYQKQAETGFSKANIILDKH